MKHLVSLSGGMGSFAELASCVDKYGTENVMTLFADVLMEDHDLYRFMTETVEHFGIEHVVISEGRTPFQVFKDEKFMGNSRIDPCSKILKRQFLTRWIKNNFSPDEVEIHVGIDFSEHHRLPPIVERCKPYAYRSTLVEDGRIIHKDFSEKYGIKPPRLYALGLGHNNCGGFCVKAGLGHYKKLLEGDPEQFRRFENEEQAVYDAVPNAKPFLKKRIDNVTHYITLKQFREHIEKNTLVLTESEKYDFGGCGCAL